jgi:flagellar motility protein MotE (MotC chaperone)
MKPAKDKRKDADVRLLPAVMAIGVILFALKAGGLAFSASAATNVPPPAQGASPAKAAAATQAPAAKPRLADPRDAINAALPVPPKSAPPAETPKPADELDPDLAAAGVSAAEMDVLTSLAERRDALEQRQRELDLRGSVITATEKRVDEKIAQLKTLQARIEALLGQREAKESEQLDGLVKVYTAMKPKDAARIFAALDNTVRIGVAGRMKPDVVAGILAALPADVAQKLTVELASRSKLPAEAAASVAAAALAPMPANAAAPPAPAPAPSSTAAAGKPGG